MALAFKDDFETELELEQIFVMVPYGVFKVYYVIKIMCVFEYIYI